MNQTIEEYPCPTCGRKIVAYITQYKHLSEADLREIERDEAADPPDIWDDYADRFCPGCWKVFEMARTTADLIYGKDRRH